MAKLPIDEVGPLSPSERADFEAGTPPGTIGILEVGAESFIVIRLARPTTMITFTVQEALELAAAFDSIAIELGGAKPS